MNFIEESNRIYAKDEAGKVIAEITFNNIDVKTVDLNHTFVDASLRGKGIAEKLILACIDKIKKEDKLIYPSCSYAISWFGKHPEYSDIITIK